MKELTKRIATLLNKSTDDSAVKAIAQTWVEMVEHGKANYGMSHEEADMMVHRIFKQEPDTFANLCQMNMN